VITDVPGVSVGHWTGGGTGVTVVLTAPGTVGSAEVRGGAPATRETDLLAPGRLVEQVDAVVLAGGSAFGLAAADGVMAHLAARGRGVATDGGPVPIVPAAALFDLTHGAGDRPGPEEGRAAAAAAERGAPIATGCVGAARSATVGKWRGAEHAVPGGLGSAAAVEEAVVVGAVAAVNCLGDVVDGDGRVLAGSTAPPGAPAFPEPPFRPGESTTLVVVATNARLDKAACHLLAISAHHGLARAIDPSHTRFDGDVTFALATGGVDAHLDRLRVAATEVTAAAIRQAVSPRTEHR
jgi:L-aminopeptidase/D-esterase-like protein